jgi:predicted nucleic acid-binding protein
MSFVVDSSFVMHVLLGSGGREALEILASGEAVAPHLIDLEVLHSVRNAMLRARTTEADSRELVATYTSFHILRYSHRPLLNRIWELRQNVRTYDAAYVALAEALNAPLFTRDRALANSSGHAAHILYID